MTKKKITFIVRICKILNFILIFGFKWNIIQEKVSKFCRSMFKYYLGIQATSKLYKVNFIITY